MNGNTLDNDKIAKNDALGKFLLGNFDLTREADPLIKKEKRNEHERVQEAVKPSGASTLTELVVHQSEWMSSNEVLKRLNISKRTLQNYRNNGSVVYTRFNGKYYYSRTRLEAYFSNK